MMSSGWRIATAGNEEVVAWLGLGSNVGDRRAHLAAALRHIGRIASIDAISPVYATAPVGFEAQADFWNLVVRVRTDLAPAALLAAVKGIEQEIGRTATFRNGPREIDVDLLLHGNATLDGEPTIPHPRMHDRAFVLRPLLDLDPALRDPRTGEPYLHALGGVRAQRLTRVLEGRALLEED